MPINFAKELNPEQLAAVEGGDGACLVLAGAGSGKTRTITYRVAYLLEKGVRPEEILLLTFTNKASREMLERVRQLVGAAPQGLWGGTFHNIGYRLVRTYAAALGLPPSLTILDSEDAERLMAQVFKEEGIDPKDRKWPSVKVVMDIYSYQRNAIIPLEEAIDIKHSRSFAVAPDLARLLKTYEQRKQQSGFVDFDDLLLLWLKLLNDVPTVGAKLAQQFKYILVDEYQDTNRVQAQIIKKMSAGHNNVFVVGDDAQSIYSFRAADIANILQFGEQYTNARTFHLLTNYRSSPEILAVANSVIAQNSKQIPKELRSVMAAWEKPRVFTCDTSPLEAEKISDEIARLRTAGNSPKEIAVLFRSTFHSQPLEMELTRRGVPYDYRGGKRFFERAHVKDVLAYLRAAASLRDTLAWQRILLQQEGIGWETANKLYEKIKSFSQCEEFLSAADSFAVDKRAKIGWHRLLSILEKLNRGNATPGGLITLVLENFYRDFLEREFVNSRERVGDVEQLARAADRATSLKDFLAETALQEQFRKNTEAATERIVLSTVHQAKGLEWDTVFVVNLTADGFPNERAAVEESGLEEERRLFYVAITRARRRLILSHSVIGGRNNDTFCAPSPFLEEIDRSLLHYKSAPAKAEAVYVNEDDTNIDVSKAPTDWRKKSFLRSVDEL